MGEDKLDAIRYGTYINGRWQGRIKTLEATPEESSESNNMRAVGEACRKGMEAGIKNTIPKFTYKPSTDAKTFAKNAYDAIEKLTGPKWPTMKYQQEPMKTITINSNWGVTANSNSTIGSIMCGTDVLYAPKSTKEALNRIYGKDIFKKSLYPEPIKLSDDIVTYCKNDINAVFGRYIDNFLNEYFEREDNRKMAYKFKIKNVIFNNPATIVFWADGTKTVVKAQNGEKFDPEKGLAMAITKRVFGDKGNYFNELKKWLPKEESKEVEDEVAKDGE